MGELMCQNDVMPQKCTVQMIERPIKQCDYMTEIIP